MADSSQPAFWDQRYETNVTPWDAGRVPDALRTHLRDFPPGARVLVPGCGSAYELYYLLENGIDALAIDFSPPAVERAKRNVGCFADRIVLADFFDFDVGAGFDVIYERAFLCALPPKLWPAYAQRTAQVLRAGGRLSGFFYFDDNPKGPPFGTSDAALRELLEPNFERIQDEPVTGSIPVFQDKERWQAWRKR